MKYYVIADPDGFFTPMKNALSEKGYFDDPEPHKLVVLGSVMGEGNQAKEMQSFLCGELENNRLIFLRGRREDMMDQMIDSFAFNVFHTYRAACESAYRRHCRRASKSHSRERLHLRAVSFGMMDTALQLTGYTERSAINQDRKFIDELKETPYVKTLMAEAKNYYETEHYVFIQGWIPVPVDPRKGWRESGKVVWRMGRFSDGIDAAEKDKYTVPGKTVVCGGCSAAYGHAVYESKGSRTDEDADNSPYYGNGIIAIGADTGITGIVNCIVIEDDPIKEVII